MADQIVADVASLNADARTHRLDTAALEATIRKHSAPFREAIATEHPHLFAAVPLFITSLQLRKMYEVIAAVERIVVLAGWQARSVDERSAAKGVFYGYDFHLNAQGVHLIEINSNAGGAFLNALLIASQKNVELPGKTAAIEKLDTSFIAMFRNEWRLERGSAPLNSIAIVDVQPEAQYLYPEFLLAKEFFEREGIATYIVDPSMLLAREDGLYFASPDGNEKIGLVYNRLTDFSLQQYPALNKAYAAKQVVLTPRPHNHAQYADKRNLARLTDAPGLRALGADEADIATLQACVPHTRVVRPDMEEMLWAGRKNLFFKPNSGYGSKGAYRGGNLTKRVFAEIMQGEYVAQTLAPPGERAVGVDDAEDAQLKYDLRCYVYDGKLQLVAARLYQGQTTNFRTAGGGFALVRVVE